MTTAREEIRQWFIVGGAAGHRFMVVVCDTFDHTDYPSYYASDVLTRAFVDNPGEMQRVMEVYDLRADREQQLAARRAWALPPE